MEITELSSRVVSGFLLRFGALLLREGTLDNILIYVGFLVGSGWVASEVKPVGEKEGKSLPDTGHKPQVTSRKFSLRPAPLVFSKYSSQQVERHHLHQGNLVLPQKLQHASNETLL